MFRWLLFAVLSCLQFHRVLAADFYVNQTWQIILSAVPDLSKTVTPDVEVWDIDAADSDVSVIQGLKDMGKVVVCYFSAGTYESWRNDSNRFSASDIGLPLEGWPGERWLNIKSSKVRDIMKDRIAMAASKGCDAVDPDNTDVDQNKNGLGITRNDVIDYIKFLTSTANAKNLKIGLKNSLGILADVQNLVDFAVNEECAKMQECNSYSTFLSSLKKPVFHIEYPAKVPTVTTAERQLFCNAPGTSGMSTLIKNLTLDGWGMFCNGQTFNSSTTPGGGRPPPPGHSTSIRTSTASPWPSSTTTWVPPPITTTTSTTTRQSSSTRTSATSTKTSSAPSPPGGCTVAHWGQCGGQDYHGCTQCVSGTTCKGVSPPWYYQCL